MFKLKLMIYALWGLHDWCYLLDIYKKCLEVINTKC